MVNFSKALDRMRAARRHFISGLRISVDTETTGIDPWLGDQPFAFSMCNDDGDTAYFEFPVNPKTRRVEYLKGTWTVRQGLAGAPVVHKDDEKAAGILRAFLGDPEIKKEFWNASFDMRMCELNGFRVQGAIEEVMFKAQICNTLENNYKLKPIANKYLNIDNEDEKLLKKLVNSCRRIGRKEGWAVSDDSEDDMGVKVKGACEADYWLPSAVMRAGLMPEKWLRDVDACRNYAVKDAIRTRGLSAFYDEVMEDEGLRHTFDEEMELWPTVYAMEGRGVCVNLDCIEREIKRERAARDEWFKKLMSFAWDGFDPDKPEQLRELLFVKHRLEIKVRTEKKKEPAVNFEALESYSTNPVVQALFKWRNACKGLQFFLNYKKGAVPDPVTGGHSVCIHPSFQQVGPVTGRFSCRRPNLQNVPNALTTRSSEPIQARTPFEPRAGYVWYHVDYHQLEALIFADVSQEMTMLAAIRDGRDLHTECTNKAWGGKGNPAAVYAAFHSLELDGTGNKTNADVQRVWAENGIKDDPLKYQIDLRMAVAAKWLESFGFDIVKAEKSLGKKTSRAKAKMILFAKVFGGGPNAIKDLLKCSFEEAQQFLRDYDVAFPTIVRYIKETSKQAKADGWIWNRYKRRINVDPDAPYRAVNYMVQGSAASQMKRAMVRLAAWLKIQRDRYGLDIHIVLTIHDELVFEVRKEHAYLWLLRGICEIMSDHEGHFSIATPVDMTKVTKNWSIKEPVALEFMNTKETAEKVVKAPKENIIARKEADDLYLLVDEDWGHNVGKWVQYSTPAPKLKIKRRAA